MVTAPDGFSSTGTGAGSTFDNTTGTITTNNNDITITHGSAIRSALRFRRNGHCHRLYWIDDRYRRYRHHEYRAITVDADDSTVSAAVQATGSGTIASATPAPEG